MPAGIDDAVMIPVYNEQDTVDAVINAVRLYHHGEILIIEDGSTDETRMVLAEREDILVLPHQTNLGYGKSIIDGLEYARFIGLQRVITMDCDGQHEPAHIPEFFDAMDEGGDILSGSRYLPESGGTCEAPADRRELNERVTKEINTVTGWGLTDAFCGFKGYRLEALAPLGLSEPGYGLPMELWAKAHLAGLEVRELPVERIYCDHGRSFGQGLDDPQQRYAYYMSVWRAALGDSS